MFYVRRDTDGVIVSISRAADPTHTEELAEDHPDALCFFSVAENDKRAQFMKSDMQMIRVLEDLIDLLINKHIITFTELPVVAQEKILERHNLRDKLSGLLSDNDDSIEI